MSILEKVSIPSLKLAEWVWLDVFHGFPKPKTDYDALSEGGFKLCLVSLELHGRDASGVGAMLAFMGDNGFEIDGICIKRPDLW